MDRNPATTPLLAVPNSVICYENARQILSQPDIAESKELADLPKLQKAAKEQARKWRDEIDPLMEKTLSEIMHYGNTFLGTYEILSRKLIPQLENNDTAQKAHKDILQLLKQKLIAPLQKKRETSEDIARRVKEFQDEFERIVNSFQSAELAASIKAVGDTLTEDGREMCSKKADAKQVKKTADRAGIACGACVTAAAVGTTAVVGASTVGIMSTGAVGAAAAVAVAGIAASPAFPIALVGVAIIGGIVVIGGIVGAIYYYRRRKNKKNDEKQLSDVVGTLQSKIDQLEQVLQQYRNLQIYTQHVVECSAKISKEWSARERDLKEIVARLEEEAERTPADAANSLESELETVNIGWKQVVDQCMVVRRASQLSPQNLEEKVDEFAKQQKWSKQHQECQKKVLTDFFISLLCQAGSFTVD